MRPRVLEVIFANTLGGAEVLLREMLRVADRARFEWHVCLLRRRAPWEEFERLSRETELGLHHVPCGVGLDPLCLWRLRRLIRRHRFDIVHTHLFRADVHGRLAARWAGVPVVLSTIHVFRTRHSGLLREALDRWTARLADRVIGCTDSITAVAAQTLRLSPDKALTIPNGTPLQPFLAPPDPTPLRAEFGLAPDEAVVGTVGRLTEEKNQADFLRMARAVHAQRPRTRFLIVGDGPCRGELERLGTSLGLHGRVVFTGPRRDIPALMNLMDVFVLSSRWEALPVTILEAMAAGTPCVATDVGGCRDVVRPGDTGWLVPPGDPDALARAVLAILADPDQAATVTARARALVVERHSIEHFTRAMEDLYEGLLSERGPRTGGM